MPDLEAHMLVEILAIAFKSSVDAEGVGELLQNVVPLRRAIHSPNLCRRPQYPPTCPSAGECCSNPDLVLTGVKPYILAAMA